MAVLTISRQFGAGGITLGEMVSKQLGYQFFDNEIIQRVTKQAKVSTDWVASVEKEAGGKIQRLLSTMVSMRLVDRILDVERGYIDEEIYVDILHEIIKNIASGVRGWAGNWDAVYDNILLRAKVKEEIMKVATKSKKAEILEAPFNVLSNSMFHQISDAVRKEVGLPVGDRVFPEWQKWLMKEVKKK